MKYITVRVSNDTHLKLRTTASAQGKLLKEFVAEILDDYASRLEVKLDVKD